MSDLEGEDMAILARFAKRPAAATLAGRRMRETRPLVARRSAPHHPERSTAITAQAVAAQSQGAPRIS